MRIRMHVLIINTLFPFSPSYPMLKRTDDDRSLWAKCSVQMITGADQRGMITPLSGIADAFENLARLIQSKKGDLTLEKFCEACSLVSVLFGCLGLAFKFAELEYVAKLRDLIEVSRSHNKLLDILDIDITNHTVKTQGSHTRNLRRVRQGLDLIRTIFANFVSSNDNSLKEAATTAYAKVCAPYHTWAVRTAVYAGMYTLPTRDQLLQKLNETDQTADKKMRRYINSSAPVDLARNGNGTGVFIPTVYASRRRGRPGRFNQRRGSYKQVRRIIRDSSFKAGLEGSSVEC